MIWDDHQSRCIGEQIETFTNPKGICKVSHVAGSMVLACLGPKLGQNITGRRRLSLSWRMIPGLCVWLLLIMGGCSLRPVVKASWLGFLTRLTAPCFKRYEEVQIERIYTVLLSLQPPKG